MIIADWWNFVYEDLMGRSAFMMLMFGWELFLMPIVLVLSILGGIVRTVLRLDD